MKAENLYDTATPARAARAALLAMDAATRHALDLSACLAEAERVEERLLLIVLDIVQLDRDPDLDRRTRRRATLEKEAVRLSVGLGHSLRLALQAAAGESGAYQEAERAAHRATAAERIASAAGPDSSR